MQLSDQQIWRIRNALWSWFQEGQRSSSGRYSWKDAMEGIEELTGTHIPAERIRQFVRGVPKDGQRTFPIPEPERLEAIYRFVTDPDMGMLAESELAERNIGVQAADRLLEYLMQDYDREIIIPPEAVAGAFTYAQQTDEGVLASQITLDRPQDNGVIKINQVERFYDPDVNSPPVYRHTARLGLPDNHRAEGRYVGWAVLTPEDNLFVFLKDEASGRNRYYFTVSTDIVHSGAGQLETFTLLHHDYPFDRAAEPLDERKLSNAVLSMVRENLQFFARAKERAGSDG